MRVKPLIVLIVLALAAAAAVLWVTWSPEPLMLTGQALVPELQQDINQVTGLRISKAGNQIVADLKRTEQGWVVGNKGNYPANKGKVRETLLLLANARLVEEKTTLSEDYERLGVQDLDSATATGTQVVIAMPTGSVSWIIGKAAGSGGGAYVRRPGSSQSFLVNSTLTLPGDVKDWLERAVLNIPASRIQAVTLHQPAGDTLTVEKQARGQANFDVSGVPPERSLKSDTVANSLGNGLAGLWLEDVAPAGTLQPADDKIITADYLTFDGLKITTRAFEANGRHYMRFDVGFDEAQAKRFAEPAAATPVATATAGRPAEANPATVRDEVNRLKARLSPWVFAIPAYKYDALSRQMEDLLQPTQEEEQEQEEPATARAEPSEEVPPGEEEESPLEPDSDAALEPHDHEDAESTEEIPPPEDVSPVEEAEPPPEPDSDVAPEPYGNEPPPEPDSDVAPESPSGDEDADHFMEQETDSEAEPAPER